MEIVFLWRKALICNKARNGIRQIGQLADWNFRFSAHGPQRQRCRQGRRRTFRVSVKQMTQVLSLLWLETRSKQEEDFFAFRIGFVSLTISLVLKRRRRKCRESVGRDFQWSLPLVEKWFILRNRRSGDDFHHGFLSCRSFPSFVQRIRRAFRWMIFNAVQFEQFEDDAIVQMFLREQNDRGVFSGVVIQSKMFDIGQNDVILIECGHRTGCSCCMTIGRGAANRRWTPEAKSSIVKTRASKRLSSSYLIKSTFNERQIITNGYKRWLIEHPYASSSKTLRGKRMSCSMEEKIWPWPAGRWNA